ncbi:DNA-binding response regulator, NarL/FixJ family, contains REC and HTH domains [Acetitomaculum ruminis DSM 5522]|uniref:Stage 0 sporulation protein A homolog n=1 Tax=Acetitomaculum ruminis DSM 5522 TaxID=1120918 RepID=A0A1I0WVY3_9FIRM|nr:response regulator transcription factor [Acetitomaculum ruminis]SFA92885.1 DNA-binding response regulator, NarL/FixJ family, contains REC and HTH domains [Acetitomaculum ruminis DSM 5522]
MVNVMIVEDQAMPRELFELYIKNSDNYKLLYSIENAAMAEIYCLKNAIDLVLMDVCTSNGTSGIEAAIRIKEKFPKIKIIIVTSMPEVSFVEKAKKAGCESFWYKDLGQMKLLEIMDQTMAGKSIYPDSTPVVEIGACKSADFNEIEIEILRSLINGKTQNEIAAERGISRSGVKYHISNMLNKTGYDSYVQLTIDVVDKHLIIPGF